MKIKYFATAIAAAALALTTALPASAHEGDGRRGAYAESGRGDGYGRGDNFRRAEITIRNNGRTLSFDRGDRMFYRLLDRPFGFRPGLTYAYTDRCNRYGCVALVFDNFHRAPIDRIFAPHLAMRGYGWRQARGFDDNYRDFGDYNRDERGFREERDGRGRDWRRDGQRDGQLEGGPSHR